MPARVPGSVTDPFGDEPVPEVPLPKTPLIKVLAQIRFPAVLRIKQDDFIAPFQEALRARYPILRQEMETGFQLGPDGMTPVSNRTWRFKDKEGAWQVSLASDFVALDTSAYTSRKDFIERIREVMTALDDLISLAVVDRIGIRYVDRLEGELLRNLSKNVRTEVLGLANLAATLEEGVTVGHSVTDNRVFLADDTQLVSRWGYLHPGVSYDPSVEASDNPSWILDMDMATTETTDFDLDGVVDRCRLYSDRLYRFFRWAVTDDLLIACEGKVEK